MDTATRFQQDRAFWLFDARKLKPSIKIEDVLPGAGRKVLAANLPPAMGWERERLLLEERAVLLDREDAGMLSAAQTARLHMVEMQLDQLEDQDPVEQEADRRLARTGDQLDEILVLLRSLPRKDNDTEEKGLKDSENAGR